MLIVPWEDAEGEEEEGSLRGEGTPVEMEAIGAAMEVGGKERGGAAIVSTSTRLCLGSGLVCVT